MATAAARSAPTTTASPPAQRVTFRLNGSSFLRGRPAPPDPDLIYYVKISTPHIHDIAISGPFYPVEAIIPQVLQHLRQNSPSSLSTFAQIVHEVGLQAFEHINAPLRNGQIMTISVIREKNAPVAATLPGPSWMIVCAEPMHEPVQGRDQFAQVKEMELCGTFKSLEDANRKMHELLREKEGELGSGARKLTFPKEDGMLVGMAMNGRRELLVEVRHDSGEVIG